MKQIGTITLQLRPISIRVRTWAMAATIAILLNGLLFLLLPILLQPSLKLSLITNRVDHIHVIRLKKEDIPPHKKHNPPKPPEEKPQKKVTTPRPLFRAKLTLPFKLNNRLPAISTDFQLPLTNTIDFDTSFHIGTVDLQELDKPITPTVRIPPVYPMRARRKGTEGWVRVGFEVNENGNVGQLHILEAQPPGVFEKSVMRCVAQWHYKAGTIEGVPVRTRMETTIRFKME